MKDLSLHLMDIFENSVKAGATEICLEISCSNSNLLLIITDNGPGLPEKILDNPTDPFKTSRTTRKVGLGLGLFEQSAEESGGYISFGESSTGGFKLKAVFDMSHIDAKPPGDFSELFLTVLNAWPEMDYIVKLDCQNSNNEVLNTHVLRKELEGIPLNHPEIRNFLADLLKESFIPLNEWFANIEKEW